MLGRLCRRFTDYKEKSDAHMIPYEMRNSSIILVKVTEYLLKFTTINFRLNEYILVTKLLTVA